MRRPSDSVARPVLAFALLALLALALVAGTGLLVIRRLADEQALNEGHQLTVQAARIVERRVNDGLLTGDAESLGAVASVVFDSILHEPIVRVKIWSADGEIVYSDEPKLIGRTYQLDDEELEVLADEGRVVSELSDLQAPENSFERSFGQLVEVYTRIQTPPPAETPLLFETYQLRSSIASNGRELAATFTPVLVVTLIALAVLLIPLAWALARRVRRTQDERERLMQRAIESSDRERRRIAGDLHDGPVQELSGLSMQLSAAAETAGDPSARDALRDSASAIRGSVKTLRSAIVGVYPPNLQQAGLAAALSDLVARLERQGIETALEVDPAARFAPEIEELLYRSCQEALRNVEEHAAAGTVHVSVRDEGGRAVLEARDDGRGIAPEVGARARESGHMGLEILGDLVRDAGGQLTVRAGNGGAGTVVRVEVPTG
jgi:two-component system, NarL family, sensor kinase